MPTAHYGVRLPTCLLTGQAFSSTLIVSPYLQPLLVHSVDVVLMKRVV